MRDFRITHVAVKPHFPVMGQTEGFTVHSDVRDDHDLGRQVRDNVAHRLGRHAWPARFAQLCREIDKLLRGQFLIPEYQNLIVVPGLQNRIDRVRRKHFCQVQSVDFRP